MNARIARLVNKLLGRGEKDITARALGGNLSHTATVIPRTQHNISRAAIPENALKVLYRLKKAGFEAYLVGGCVRDLLLGKLPKDFDVTTDAHPEEIKKLFKNCILIGRRFRLAHIRFGKEIFEVATFRARSTHTSPEFKHDKGMILRDNVYGSMEEDAFRRDFTVNALYYNIKDFSVVDYCEGMEDLQQKTIRIIGNPIERYHEDPVRLLRAIRFAAKLEFHIEHETSAPISELSGLLAHIPSARLFDETMKLFLGGQSLPTLNLLREYRLFDQLFPQTATSLANQNNDAILNFIIQGFKNTDQRIAAGKSVNPAFLIAVLLWPPFQILLSLHLQKNSHQLTVADKAAHTVISQQLQRTAIPRRFTLIVREIWLLQYYFQRRTPKHALHLLQHRRFRAGYDFLLLRTQAGEDLEGLDIWWTKFLEGDEIIRNELLASVPLPKKRRRKVKTKKQNNSSTDNTHS